jgi:hypothetical protein
MSEAIGANASWLAANVNRRAFTMLVFVSACLFRIALHAVFAELPTGDDNLK